MQLQGKDVDDYVSRLVGLFERYGVVVTQPAASRPIEILEADDGALSFEIIGSLPDGREPARSSLEIRERFRPAGGDVFERDRYEYELVDREGGFRRAFHLHDPEWFERRYLVVVHEHCERPIGDVPCAHYQGSPIRDAYAGIVALLNAWTADPPDCSALDCLDP